jgi:hypothetical protein
VDDKRTLEAKKQLLENARMVHKVSADTIDRLEKEFAEEKVELRHGDYGISPEGSWTRVHGSTWWDTKDCTGPSNQNAATFLPYRLGNIFADLAALSEDVESFEVGNVKAYYDKDKWLVIDEGPDRVGLLPSEISAFIRGLRQMEATMKRKQK